MALISCLQTNFTTILYSGSVTGFIDFINFTVQKEAIINSKKVDLVVENQNCFVAYYFHHSQLIVVTIVQNYCKCCPSSRLHTWDDDDPLSFSQSFLSSALAVQECTSLLCQLSYNGNLIGEIKVTDKFNINYLEQNLFLVLAFHLLVHDRVHFVFICGVFQVEN